jgi:cobalamin biosynthesis protein CbiD
MDKVDNKSSRRGLIFGAAAAGSAAAALVVLPQVAQQEAAVEAPKPAPERGGGYSVTEHVKRYYSTTLI